MDPRNMKFTAFEPAEVSSRREPKVSKGKGRHSRLEGWARCKTPPTKKDEARILKKVICTQDSGHMKN